jgi:hypothetical protein
MQQHGVGTALGGVKLEQLICPCCHVSIDRTLFHIVDLNPQRGLTPRSGLKTGHSTFYRRRWPPLPQAVLPTRSVDRLRFIRLDGHVWQLLEFGIERPRQGERRGETDLWI